VCTCTEHTTVVSGASPGEAWDTRSIQDCRFFTKEEAELCEVIVLTGEDSEPLVSLGSGEE
jgi:hypothetical protein